MKFTVQWTDPQGGEPDVEVEGTLMLGRPAKLTGPPEDCYEAEAPEFIIENFTVGDGLEHDELIDDEDFLDQCLDAALDKWEAAQFDREDECASDREFAKEYDHD